MLLVGPRVAISSVSEFASGAIPSLSACVRTPRTSRSKSNATARCSGTERARRYSTCKVANPGQGRSTLLPRSSPCWRARNVPDSTWSSSRFFGLPATTTTARPVRNQHEEAETEAADVLHDDSTKPHLLNHREKRRSREEHRARSRSRPHAAPSARPTELSRADIGRVALTDDVAVAGIELDEECTPARLLGGDQRRSRAGEHVRDDVAGLAAVQQVSDDERDRFRGGVVRACERSVDREHRRLRVVAVPAAARMATAAGPAATGLPAVDDVLVLVVVVAVAEHHRLLDPHERLVDAPAGVEDREPELDAPRRPGDVEAAARYKHAVDRGKTGTEKRVRCGGRVVRDRLPRRALLLGAAAAAIRHAVRRVCPDNVDVLTVGETLELAGVGRSEE